MKIITSRLCNSEIIRTALFVLMLLLVVQLFGNIPLLNECPLNLDFEVTPLDGTYEIGSRFLFTFTISMSPDLVTEYDKQRVYQINSSYFVDKKGYGSLRTISTDIHSGETFTYSQFPITRHLKVRFFDDVGSGQIDVNVRGYAVKGCPETTMQELGKDIQQLSYFYMYMPDHSENKNESGVFATRYNKNNMDSITTKGRTQLAGNASHHDAHKIINKIISRFVSRQQQEWIMGFYDEYKYKLIFMVVITVLIAFILLKINSHIKHNKQ